MDGFWKSEANTARYKHNVKNGMEGKGYRTMSGINANSLDSIVADLDERAAEA